MSRVIVPALVVLLLPLAGCIAPPEDVESAALTPKPPVDERVEGMTAAATQTDRVEPCANGDLLSPYRFCATRDLFVEGRVGIDELPVKLEGVNGPIRIVGGEGDAWSMRALVTVAAATEQEARDGLDTAWTWSVEKEGAYALYAGPAEGPVSLPVLDADPRVRATTYEITLPGWLVLDLDAETGNGAIDVADVETKALKIQTSNGAVDVRAFADDVDIDTSNGAVRAELTPRRDGSYDIETSNGRVDLTLWESRRHGFDIEAKTSNGRIDIDMDDGETTFSEDGDEAHFRTTDFDLRTVRTHVSIQTSNGSIDVQG